MERFVKTDATVLRRIVYKDADRLLVLCTKELGKVTVKAKGVRKLQSKNRSHIELFTHLHTQLVAGKAGWILTQTTTLETFSKLRKDLAAMQFAYAFAELFHALVPEAEKNDTIFAILRTFLARLNREASPGVVNHATIRLLVELGYLSRESFASLPQNMRERALQFIDTKETEILPIEHTENSRQTDMLLFSFLQELIEEIIEKPLKTKITQM